MQNYRRFRKLTEKISKTHPAEHNTLNLWEAMNQLDEAINSSEPAWDEINAMRDEQKIREKRQARFHLMHQLFDSKGLKDSDDSWVDRVYDLFEYAEEVIIVKAASEVPSEVDGQKVKYRWSVDNINVYTDAYKEYIYIFVDDTANESTEGTAVLHEIKRYNPNAALTWEEKLELADQLLERLINETDNADADDGDGYWQDEYNVWCNRCIYSSNFFNNKSKLDELIKEFNTNPRLPGVEFYYIEDDADEDPVSEIGYTLTKQSGDR